MTIDHPPLANEPAPRGTRGDSRSIYSWVLGVFLGAVLTVILMGALVWVSTGLGLLHLMAFCAEDERSSMWISRPWYVKFNNFNDWKP